MTVIAAQGTTRAGKGKVCQAPLLLFTPMRAIVSRPARLTGTLSVPGDKSISHRAVLFGALARGITRITGLARGADVLSSVECVRRLGVTVRDEGEVLVLDSPGPEGFNRKVDLDCGNSGTTARLLMGLLAPIEGLEARIHGDESLSGRPMKRVSEPLAKMGARIELQPAGTLPAIVHGTRLTGHSFTLKVASAQVKTALLLAGLGADGETWVKEPSLSRDHTERMFPVFGADILRDGDRVGVRKSALTGTDVYVPGDASSAAFFAAAAALLPGSQLTIEGANTNVTRVGFVEAALAMGAPIAFEDESTQGEPYARWVCGESALSGTTIAGELVPRLVDEIPVLSVMAAVARGVTEIRDAEELRVKESDRLAVMANGLKSMGADIDERPDGLVIRGGKPLSGGHVDAHADHRIAMSFAVAGLVADGETIIDGAEWADVSFPGFWDTLNRLGGGCVRLEG